MKKLLTNTTKSAYKGIVFWTFFWLTVFSVAYAASITSTTDPTVSSWDSITANWYQDVNNKLWGISVSSGNVGIGTSSPQRKFVVSNNNEEGFEFYPGDSLGWNTINHYNRSTASFVNIINNADQHIFWRADGEKMRIDSYGRVGIGTKTPTEDLTIAGTKSGNQVTDATIDFGILNSNGDSKKAQIKAIGTADISSELIFSTTKSHSFWERMRIDENGNVWIRVAEPQAKLHVNTSGKAIQLWDWAGNWWTWILFAWSSTNKNWFVWNQDNVDDAFEITPTDTVWSTTIGTTPAVVVKWSGNVWIWITEPLAKLDVVWGWRFVSEGVNWGAVTAQWDNNSINLRPNLWGGWYNSASEANDAWIFATHKKPLIIGTHDWTSIRFTESNASINNDLSIWIKSAPHWNAKLRVNWWIQSWSMVEFNWAFPDGKIFSLASSYNWDSAYMELEVMSYEWYRKEKIFFNNASWIWYSKNYDVVSSGTAPIFTVTAWSTWTVTISCTWSYTPRFRVSMTTNFVVN